MISVHNCKTVQCLTMFKQPAFLSEGFFRRPGHLLNILEGWKKMMKNVDSGNSEDSVDKKLAEGFFEGKISGSKRRESERFADIAEDSIFYFTLVERFK